MTGPRSAPGDAVRGPIPPALPPGRPTHRGRAPAGQLDVAPLLYLAFLFVFILLLIRFLGLV